MEPKIDLDQILDDLGPLFASRAGAYDDNDRFAADNYADLIEYNIFSGLIPLEYGGGGATHDAMCQFLRRLAHHCPSTALALSMHQHLVAAAVANDRAGRPGRKLLDKVAESELVLVSTGANDWLESNGTAEPVEGGYLISAIKPFASGSPAGDLMVTSARLENDPDDVQVLHFPLSLRSEGVTFLDDWRTLGMRATGSQTIKLENVFVHEEAVVLKRPSGPFHPAFAVILTVALPLIMSAYLGTAEAAVAIARERAGKRGDDGIAPVLVGEMLNALTTAELATADMIRLANNFDFTPSAELASEVLIRKTLAANAVKQACDKALEVSGGAGFFRKA
ncbi:MAG: acyl-CoA dehydrogenase family protein, partial [Geminicoccaceae bacterium]